MLTPQEIQEKKFEKAMFGGYDMGQIDQFLDDVLNDYASLYKENAALKAKMRVLVDKIEEYRAVDEELRKTLYNAQVSAKDTVSRAQTEADRILRDARTEASRHVDDLKDEIAEEEARLAAAKRNNMIYAERIRKAMEQSMANLEQVLALSEPEQKNPAPQAEPASAPAPEEALRAEPAESPDLQATRVRIFGEEELRAAVEAAGKGNAAKAEEPAEPAPTEEPLSILTDELRLEDGEEDEFAPDPKSDTARIYGDSPYTPKPRFDFDDLRFGKNFEEEESDNEE